MTRGLHFQSKKQLLSNGMHILVSKVLGAIDGVTVREFENKMIEFFHQGLRYLILNFKDIKYINSTGMGLLIKIADKYQENGGDIKLVQVPEKVLALFDMLGLVNIFKVYDDEESAISEIVRDNRRFSKETKPFENSMGVSSIDLNIKPTAVNFPFITNCIVCAKKLKFTEKGNFKCHGCCSYISINTNGQQTVHAKMNSDIIDLSFPCNVYHKNLAIFAINGLVQQMGYSANFWEEIKEAIHNAINIALEKNSSSNGRLHLLAVADQKEIVIGLKSLHAFLDVKGPRDPRLPAIATKVDKLEVFPLATGQLLKINKKRAS